jgi:hypothetical protein
MQRPFPETFFSSSNESHFFMESFINREEKQFIDEQQ